MAKRARKNINFRQTRSERSATNSYRGFKRVILNSFQNLKSLKMPKPASQRGE